MGCGNTYEENIMNNINQAKLKIQSLRKSINVVKNQKEKIKLIQETAKILQDINAEKTKHLDQAIELASGDDALNDGRLDF